MTEFQLPAGQQRRAFWLRHLHQWHWVSAALCLIGMLLFAFTGFTLNHAAQVESRPQIVKRQSTVPQALHGKLAEPELAAGTSKATAAAGSGSGAMQPVPPELADWLRSELGVDASGRPAEWSADEIYIALPQPGGDAWISVERDTGAVQYELTTRGWIAYLNDLHKGRNTGEAWSLFLDVFALACVVFCVTGLFLLKLHARGRVATWPLVGLGLAAPLMLAILFIH